MEKDRGSKVAARAEEAECGEGESLADGSVVAKKRGNARGAKGPCRSYSEQEARREWDEKTHRQSAGAWSEERTPGEIRPRLAAME
jgi:hypothetical protein